MPPTTVLITGAAGQLGHALTHRLGVERAVPKPREALDITDVARVREWLPVLRPDMVVNCAAFTNTEKAERSRAECWRVNTLAVHNLIQVCNELSIPFLHVSTAHVFGQDEARSSPYTEEDTPGPLSHCAQTKCAAEHAILSATRGCSANSSYLNCGGWWILRTSGLYEKPWRPYRNFPQLLLATTSAKREAPLEVVHDIMLTPTYVPHLVEAVMEIIDNADTFPWGIYHVTNSGQTSLYDFAQKMSTCSRRKLDVSPTSRETYFQRIGRDPALIPRYAVLSGDKWSKTAKLVMPHWEIGVEQFFKEWNRTH